MAAQEEAWSHGLGGWVRNLRDGRVEVLAEGDEENVLEFVDWCRLGPPMAHVANMECEYEDATGEFRAFTVEHTT